MNAESQQRRYVFLSLTGILLVLILALAYIGVILQLPKSSPHSASVSETSIKKSYSATASTKAEDWLAYHHDGQRTGYLTSSENISLPSERWTFDVDGAVYAEPLIYNGSTFVVTENDSVYSLSISDASLKWHTKLGTPVPLSSLQCGGIDPVGITGTPVIDSSTSTLYVTALIQGSGYRLYALSTDSGRILWSTGLSQVGFDYHVQQQRGALALADGMVYIPFGGFQRDCGNYHGWVMGYHASGSGKLIGYQVASTREAGIWATGGVVVSPTGGLLVATGNGESTTTFDYGESVIKLDFNLGIAGFFAPTNWASLNREDKDLGSFAPLELGNGLIFQIGKEGVGYLLNETKLGGIGGQLYYRQLCTSSYGAGAVDGDAALVPCTDGLYKVAIQSSGPATSYSVIWSDKGFTAGPPIIAYGAAWVVDIENGTLFAMDRQTGTTHFHASLGPVVHFTTPAAGEGRIIVAATDKIYCFG